jgi:sulfide:quinone oxidoreductase
MAATRVLIAGGGVAALEALLALRDLAGERVEVELLSPRPELEYRPLAVAEPFGIARSRSYELEPIARDQGATLRKGGLAEVHAGEHRVVTNNGETIDYDVLLVAVGAKPGIGLPGAVTVKGPRYTSRFRALLAEIDDGRLRHLTFAVPPGVAWPIPLYELALLTATHATSAGRNDLEISLVTPEAEPLELFGAKASAAARDLLWERGIDLVTDRYPAAVEASYLTLVPPDPPRLATDRVVSLPRLHGPSITGLPADRDGFLETDPHARVLGVEDVYAAGDASAFPIKQGGIATQQADAAAESIAALAGAEIEPQTFRPILRGMLLTGDTPRYMRAEISGGRGQVSETSNSALWWPPSKIAGRYLSPYLGLRHDEFDAEGGGVPVEVELEAKPSPGVQRRAIISPEAGLLRGE